MFACRGIGYIPLRMTTLSMRTDKLWAGEPMPEPPQPRYETILHNPKSGISGTELTSEGLQRMVDDAGLHAEVVAVRSDMFEDAIKRCIRDGAERVLIAGGDGTVARAARVLAHTKVALGVLPTGGANNFAAAVGLPTTDLRDAIEVLKSGVIRAVSLGKTGEGYVFTETAGVGLFADGLALYGGARQEKLKAIWVWLRLLTEFKAAPLRLTLDGKRVAHRAILCTVANTYRMADFMPVAPDASLGDAVFDVVVIEDVPTWELPRYFTAVRRGQHIGMPGVRVHRAREIVIETLEGEARHVYADDQIVGTTPATMTLMPGALRMVVPAPSAPDLLP
jgi:diacylglycerol kinase (ATP)